MQPSHTPSTATPFDQPTESQRMETALLDERSKSRLKWRCRRGLLENDLLIERFFKQHEETLTESQAVGLMALMDLADNDLLDLLLRRQEPSGGLDTPEVHVVLGQLRPSVDAPAPR
jgi:antitoxin CptB